MTQTAPRTSSEQQKEIDDFKKDVEHYRTLKEKVAEIKEEVENLESELAAAEVSISQKDEDVNKLSVHMNEIEGKEKRIKDLQREIESLGIKKTALENTLYNLRQNIQTFFTGSRDELEQQLNDFKKTVEEKELELQKVEQDSRQIEMELKQRNEERRVVLLKHGQLKQEQKQHQDNVTKRNEAAKEFASQYGISDFQQEMTDSNIEDFQREMKKKCDEFQESCRKKKEEFDVKEQDIRGKENEAWEEKTKMETELRSKQKTMKEQEAEIHEITVKLREVATSEDTLNTVQNDLSKAKKDLEKERESASTEELNEELKVMIKEKSEFEKKFKNLQCELEELRKDSKVRTELDIYQKDRSNKQDQIRELRNKNEDSLKRLLRLPEMPTENLDKTLQDFLKQQDSDIKHINEQLENKKKSLYSLEFDRKNVIRQREEKEQELDEYNKQFLNTCNGIENFNDALKQIQRKIEDLSLTQGTSRVLKEYIEKLKKENAPCPLCKRKFDNQSAIQELVDDLETEIKNLPYIRNVNTEILENQEKYKKLQQLEPFLANVEDLGKKKLPDLKDEQQSIEEQLRKIESGILELTENLEKKQDDVTSASSLQPDLRSIDGYNEDIHELDRRIISLREKLTASTISSNRSEEQVYSEWQEMQTILEKKNNEIESKRCEIKDHNDRRNNLSASINQLQSQALAIEKDVLPKLNLEEKKTQLLQQNESLSVEIQKTELDIKPVKEKINKYAAERNYAISERDKLCKQLDDKYKNCENDRKEINFLDDAIKSYWNRGSAKDLEENTIKMQKINEEAEKLESDQKSKIMSISTMQKDLNSQEMKKRELRDNLTYKENQEECQKIEENIQKLEMNLEGLKVFSVDSKKKELDDERERLKNEKYRLQGTVGGLESEIQKKQDELTSVLYKDAEEKFVENIVKLKTTEEVCADLHKYYRAVDRALRSYHEEKIREVNDRIQDLWRETYRGTDIEMIEIDAGEEAALPDPSDMEQKRRNYNYRVVMYKGDTRMDMRGQCSAGQKVLASLIIRLALAETFCLNCGILALDEPTTNLDRENIESLACALVDIIKSRAQNSSNFQLIVITHNIKFVEMIGKSDYVEHYFEVERDWNGLSILKKKNINGISE